MYRTKELWVASFLYTLNVIPDRVEYHDSSGRVFFVYDNLDERVGVGLEAAYYSGDPRLTAHLPTLARGFALCRKWMRFARLWRRSFNLTDIQSKVSEMVEKRGTKEVPPQTLDELVELLEISGDEEGDA